MGRSILVALVLAVAAAGCAAHTSSGPAWPKLHDDGTDGGQSLAPHVASTGPGPAAAAADATDDDPLPATGGTTTPAATPDDPAPQSAAPAAGDPNTDTVTIDGVTIEVDD